MSDDKLKDACDTLDRYLGLKVNLTEDSDDFTKISVAQIFGGVWCRPGLEWRDRSLITLVALIVQNHMHEVEVHMGGARRMGFTLREIEEICLHLGYYIGFINANAAIGVARRVFAKGEPQKSPG